MLTREDRARLLRETVLKTSNIDNIILPAQPRSTDHADLVTPHHRKNMDPDGGDTVDLLRLARNRQNTPGREHAGQDSPATPPPHVSRAPPPPDPSVLDDNRENVNRHANADLEARNRRLENEIGGLNRRVAEMQRGTLRSRDDQERSSRENTMLRDRYEALVKQHEGALNAANSARRDAGSWAQITPEEWKEANERVDVLIAENDLLMERTKAREHELEELRDHVARTEKLLTVNNQELQESQQHVATLRRELGHAVEQADMAVRETKRCADQLTECAVENDRLRVEVGRCNGDIKNQQEVIGDLKASLEEITTRYQKHVRESQLSAARERELFENLKVTEHERDDYKAKYAAIGGEHTALRAENEELLTLSKTFESRIEHLETKQLEAHQEVQRQIEIAAEAKLECDKALIRDQQSQTEIQRLTDKVLEMPQRSRERADHEIATMRAQFLSEKQPLLIELDALEAKCSHLQNQADRAIREKRAAESELEKVTRHIPEETERIAITLEDLNGRLRASEREKCVALGRLEGLHQKLLREENRFEKEKQLVAERSDEAFRRLRVVERDLEETKEDRLHMLTKLTDLEHAHKKLAESKQKCVTQYEADISAATERHQDHVKELTTKLETVSESHARTCRDIQQLLSDQKRLHDKWKQDQIHSTTTHAHALSDLRSQLAHAAARIDDLTSQMSRLDAHRKELLGQLGEEKRGSARMATRLASADQRVEQLGRALAGLKVKEGEWVDERNRLQRDLDRARLDRERGDRELASRTTHHQHRSFPSARFRASQRSTAAEDDDDDDDEDGQASKVTGEQVRELRAEIDRVKNRATARSQQHHSMRDELLLAAVMGTDDDGLSD
ncbi:hypothetical protein HKX48_009309 [Thoreauomyces humboldtii]|nr:hypothetical protein HKX48_009309 [Thoreauomyces humboldtii]